MRKRILLFAIWMACGTAHAKETGRTAATFLTLGTGPRAVAMGEAQVGLADDVYATYWNPAGLAQLRNSEAGFVHTQLPIDIQSQYVAYAHPTTKHGTWAGSITHLRTGDWDAYDATGTPIGQVSAADTAFGISYAYPFLLNKHMRTRLSAGATAKWIHERLDTVSGNGYAVDAGLLYSPGRKFGDTFEGFQAGLALKNVGSRLTFDQEPAPLPTSLSAGLAWTGLWLGEALRLTADAEQAKEGTHAFGAGVELTSLRLLMLRGGYSTRTDLGSGLRFGAGIRFRTIQLDYAYAASGALGQTHRLGMTMRFGLVPLDPVLLAQDSYQLGMRAFRRAHWTDALIQFNKTLETDAGHPDALRMMKETHEKLKAAVL